MSKGSESSQSGAQAGATSSARTSGASTVVPLASNKQTTAVPKGSVAAGYEQPASGGGSGLIGVGAGAAAASAAGLGFVLKRRRSAGQLV
ncbi:hypothetical protein ACIGW8_32975 [Streptomyces sioyaensis]|uniref:hypothetical protein n=1 Tax=Streptomyces sioyaensis TaxID=67364 RepID=UPI0037D777A6